jgi:hypothetical protein
MDFARRRSRDLKPGLNGLSRSLCTFSGVNRVLVGFLILETILLTIDENPVIASTAALPPIQRVMIDERGRITVNGKPFFPILLYDGPTDTDSLGMFQEHGFNTLTITKQEEAKALLQRGLYAAVQPGGKKIENLQSVLLAIGMDSPALHWKEKWIEKTKADLEHVRSLVPDRPVMHAINYWANQPAVTLSNTILPKPKYEDLIQAMDVAAPYLYTLPFQPIGYVGEAVGRAGIATQGRKPVIPIFQLSLWNGTDRHPGPAELRCMVYVAVIHGADGIGYHSYYHDSGTGRTTLARERPELWRAAGQINTEVAAIAALLSDGLPAPFVTLREGAPDVEFRAATKGALQLILLANTCGSAKHISLKFSENLNMKLNRLGGGTEVIVKEGQVNLRLDPFEAVALVD